MGRGRDDGEGGQALIERACAAHGGIETWERTMRITGSIRSLGGPIPRLKGLGVTYEAPGRFRVHPHEHSVEFLGFPGPEEQTVFCYRGGHAGIARRHRNAETFTARFRERFLGLRKWRLWGPEEVAYFLGYALLTYVSVPFLLRELRVLRADESSVTVRFPESFESHCAVQRFEIGTGDLIARHDYTADILGAVFHGAHLSSDYVSADGLMLARKRRVTPRVLGRVRLPIAVLSADLAFDADRPAPTAPS